MYRITRGLAALLLLCGASLPLTSVAANSEAGFADFWRALVDDAIHRCSAGQSLHSTDLAQSLQVLYEAHAYAPLWQDGARQHELQQQIAALAADALPLQDFAVLLQGHAAEQAASGCLDIDYSIYYLRALEQLSQGRLPAEEHETVWVAAGATPAAQPDALVAMAVAGLAAAELSAAFDMARPQFALYQQLRVKWLEWQQLWQAQGQPQRIDDGPLLRQGMLDARVPQIVARLQAERYLRPDPQGLSALYDASLEAAVRRFQQHYQLQQDGIVGPQTVAAMNVPLRERSQQVAINLERLRWLSARKADYTLLINIAGGDGRLYRDGTLLWQSRVQAGRASRATPDLISVINRITLNPSWTVPPTILRQDVLPRIRNDIAYLQENEMDVIDAQGNRLDPREVDWRSASGIILRQRPGPDNPLGRQVFRFPNPFSVYLHDTPSQHLFDVPARHFSSGCVRMDDAESLMWMLMQDLSIERRELISEQLGGGRTHEVQLPNGPQVVLAYWTAGADGTGLQFMPDPYRRDRALMAAYFSD